MTSVTSWVDRCSALKSSLILAINVTRMFAGVIFSSLKSSVARTEGRMTWELTFLVAVPEYLQWWFI